MTHFLYLVRHGEAVPHDGPLSPAGEQQARLTGRRLKDVPLSAIHHGPLPRAAQTAGLIAACIPGVPVSASDLAGDYLPSDPAPDDLPPSYASFVAGFSAAERAQGPRLAAAAIDRFTQAGARGRRQPRADRDAQLPHRLARQPGAGRSLARWLGLNQMNCALSVIAYRAGLPPALISFNDTGHLTPELRWNGFPAAVRPASG
jgi:hypothetical protein